MAFFEIVAVFVSVIILLLSAVLAARSGLLFKRTFSIFRKKAEPKAYNLINGGEIAQTRAFEIINKLDILQNQAETARKTIFRMWTLIKVVRDTWAKIAPVLGYVGL